MDSLSSTSDAATVERLGDVAVLFVDRSVIGDSAPDGLRTAGFGTTFLV